MPVPAGFDANTLAQQLGMRIASLAQQLLPAGRRVHGDWRVGSLAGEEGQSLCVHLSGQRMGQWKDFASGQGGDALDLVAQTCCQGSKSDAVRWARDWLGLGRLDPAEIERLAERARRRAAELARQGERDDRHKREDAFAIWRAARTLERGDPVWRYLGDRGIDLDRLTHRRGALGALRHHPRLRHPEGTYWPAMVALIAGADGRPVAIHRTWLAPRNLAMEPHPMVGKAPVANPKMTLGRYAGGLIRLWRGESGRAWKDAREGDRLVLAEGIEDVLSFVQVEPRWRAAAAVSLSAMLAVELPPAFAEIMIVAQNDRRESAAAKTLDQVVERFIDEGRRVFVWRPPAFVKDVNELIRHPAAAMMGGRQ